MRKKEELQQVHSLSIRKQLGKTFDHERFINKRLKEDGEFKKVNKATHSQAYQSVMARKSLLERNME
jgi:hypothetical protein